MHQLIAKGKCKMSSTKKTVRTPLHLLHDLSDTLVNQLQTACIEAQQEAEKALTKLEKQRVKIQEKLIKAEEKLAKANEANKAKAKAKAQKAIIELKDSHNKLQNQQQKLFTYLNTLKKDSTKSLELAKGITRVKERVSTLLNPPAAKATSTATKAPLKTAPAVAKQATRAVAKKPVAKTPSKPRATATSKTTPVKRPVTRVTAPKKTVS